MTIDKEKIIGSLTELIEVFENKINECEELNDLIGKPFIFPIGELFTPDKDTIEKHKAMMVNYFQNHIDTLKLQIKLLQVK